MIIGRRFEWDAAHVVLGHEGHCANLHGHRYAAEVMIFADELNNLGMVIDFAEIKKIIGGWIDENWDHNILLHKDHALAVIWRKGKADRDMKALRDSIFGKKVPWITDLNPTGENLAKQFFLNVSALLPDSVKLVSVRLFETPNCWADYGEQFIVNIEA